MTRSELKEWGIEEKDVIDKIMAGYGDGIEKAKADVETYKSQIAEKEKSIAELNEQIKGFDGKDEALKGLQDKVAAYEKAEAKRVESEKQSKIDADLKARFTQALGENKFKHSDIETGRFNAFKDALSNPELVGKGDSEIFESITKDLDCFVNPQQERVEMPGGGSIPTGANDDARVREIMGLPKK